MVIQDVIATNGSWYIFSIQLVTILFQLVFKMSVVAIAKVPLCIASIV